MSFKTSLSTLLSPLLQTLSSQSNKIGAFLGAGVSFALTMTRLLYGPKFKPFISTTVNELLFGYEDTLVNMAHTFYPRNIRPDMSKMGLLLGVSEFYYDRYNYNIDCFGLVAYNCRRFSIAEANY